MCVYPLGRESVIVSFLSHSPCRYPHPSLPFPSFQNRAQGGGGEERRRRSSNRENKKGNGEEGKREKKWWKRKPQTFFSSSCSLCPFLPPSERPSHLHPAADALLPRGEGKKGGTSQSPSVGGEEETGGKFLAPPSNTHTYTGGAKCRLTPSPQKRRERLKGVRRGLPAPHTVSACMHGCCSVQVEEEGGDIS